MTLAEQLHGAGVRVFPVTQDKRPAVKGWQDPLPPAEYQWPSDRVGVPIPAGVFVVDLDTYKGVTRAAVEQALGGPLPWDAAMIQRTANGGEHYAFRSDVLDLRQGADLLDVIGFDTRRAGAGFIVTGEGYAPHGFGLFALAHPAALPPLPDTATRALRRPEPTAAPAPRDAPANATEAATALQHIDPDCTRDEWVRVGMALRNLFSDEPATGEQLFHDWSARGAETYTGPEDVEQQWASFKPDGGITGATLFHVAMRAGWVPPKSFDTASAFGPTAAPADAYAAAVEDITAHAIDPLQTPRIIEAVRTFTGSAEQSGVLRALLARTLKEDGQLTPELRDLTRAPSAPSAGLYDKNHTSNAQTFLTRCYPDNRLMRLDEVWYGYEGKAWAELPDAEVRHRVTAELEPSLPQIGTIVGTYAVLAEKAYRPSVAMNQTGRPLVVFDNVVLDLATGELLHHHPDQLTTKLLPYAYRPEATCPRWLRFMSELFAGDSERVELLQQWLGYMLSPTYQYQKIMLFIGPLRAGKSLIGQVLEALVGERNHSAASLDSFAADDFLDSLRGKTAAFSGDTAKRVNRTKIDTVIERLKKISGGDAVDFGRKYKSRQSVRLPTRITLSSNHVPRLFDDSEALAHRLLVLPFDVSFADREDPYLIDALLSEIEGIAVWALQGLAQLNAQGQFTVPASSRDETTFIAETFNPLRAFIEGRCILGGDAVVKVSDLYDAYRVWATAEQHDTLLGRNTMVAAFKDATRGRGCKYAPHRVGDSTVRGFKGLSLVDASGTGSAGTAAAFQTNN